MDASVWTDHGRNGGIKSDGPGPVGTERHWWKLVFVAGPQGWISWRTREAGS